MKQSMKKAALVLMLALAVLLVPQWSNTALAVTTPSDITTGSDLPPAPPLPTPPAKGEVVISGAKTVRGGEKLTFSVTIDGKNVPNSDLEWTLYPADASLATIKSGVITTKRVAYTHYVQVSAALKSDPSRYANFRLCIAPGVKKITVSAPTTYVDLSGSKTLQLKATCDPEDAITDVTWSSSSSKIATVDASGLVTARKTGKVTITATAKDGSKVKGSINLRVVSGVTGLTIEGASSVAAGKSITLKAVMMPADATEKSVVWSVDCDKSIASISQSGKLTTKKISAITTITVTAVSKQNSAIRATHTVTIRPVTTGLAISAPRLTIDLASPTLQLTAKCIPEDASQQVAWSTSNKRIATVDANGLVTAKKVGKVTITAKATDGSGRSAKITLTVGSAVGTLEIRGASAVAQGKTITLNAVITPATATNQKVIWSVDCGKDIATIDRHGRLKAGKGFTAPVTITVTAVSAENSAITATRTVQILPPVTTVAISAPRNYIDVDGEDKTLQLTARVLPEDAAQSVTWSTSNKRIATVDANGVVTALKAGTVTITATATDGTGVRAKFTVKVQKTVKSLTISGAEKLGGGQSTTIKATILPKDAANQKVIYSLNCPASVATISTSGVLTTKNVTEITNFRNVDACHLPQDDETHLDGSQQLGQRWRVGAAACVGNTRNGADAHPLAQQQHPRCDGGCKRRCARPEGRHSDDYRPHDRRLEQARVRARDGRHSGDGRGDYRQPHRPRGCDAPADGDGAARERHGEACDVGGQLPRERCDDFWRREAARVRKRGNTNCPRHRDGE